MVDACPTAFFKEPFVHHTSFTYVFIWVRKLDSNSLTKTKNWSGRNEVIETSRRLHTLWPQNIWLYTPRTTDYRHTRQDRWIQTEMAFALAKNATKLNPFEIIPLQTTRKEKNWKTEEALARAAVTLKTERIKGFSSWWWWWWWWPFVVLRQDGRRDIWLLFCFSTVRTQLTPRRLSYIIFSSVGVGNHKRKLSQWGTSVQR